MRKETNMAGVKSVAKALLMLDIHLTDYSPVIVQHPFTSSGMVAAPTENGLAMLDITQGDENLSAWVDGETDRPSKKRLSHLYDA